MHDKNLPSTSMATGEEGGGDPKTMATGEGIAMFVAFDRATWGPMPHNDPDAAHCIWRRSSNRQ
ncbi:MAG TPA: hypothetical protein VHQ94_05645 [Pyrinomonadaceae bacterium]|jgi:hypothetical protein|nr:hypothetical protein [Pyrinomonadaceae bacterium]